MGRLTKRYYYSPTDGNPYTTDFGDDRIFVGRFDIPDGLAEGTADGVVAALGATPVPIGDVTPIPCADSATKNFNPRFLEFAYRSIDGGNRKLKLALAQRADVVTTAQAVKAFIEGAAPGGFGGRVGCVRLIGEKHTNVYERFAPAAAKTITNSPQFALAKYAPNLGYTADVQPGQVITTSINVETDGLNLAPSTITNWDTLANALAGLQPCGGERKIRDIRRFIVDTVYLDPNGNQATQKTVVPVASNVAATIAAGGTALAALGPVICLGYRGETFDRLNRFLT